MNSQAAQPAATSPRAAPYASALAGPALDVFDHLVVAEQVAIDEALNALEWEPFPDDALDVVGAYAVRRCGFWLVYERDDAAKSIVVWVIAPND